jgi:hypothetical protein
MNHQPDNPLEMNETPKEEASSYYLPDNDEDDEAWYR